MMIRFFHRIQDTARGYSLTQILGYPTIRRYHAFVSDRVKQESGRRILEIGCGVGSARDLFGNGYTGIDINPNYIQKAKFNYEGCFSVMDAADMSFDLNSFDDAVSIATTHHLSDEVLALMIRKAVSVATCLHIIDAILPIAGFSPFKTLLFKMDRGQHVRTIEQLLKIVGQNAQIECHDIKKGPLHDVCYIRAARFQKCENSSYDDIHK